MRADLICPGLRPAVSHFADCGSLVTTPVLGESVVGHWIHHLAAQGARRVRIFASDHADQVRANVGTGARWGVQIEVVPSKAELSPAEAAKGFPAVDEGGGLAAACDPVLMSHLPGCPELPLFDSYAGWFAAVFAWLHLVPSFDRLRMKEIRPGVWVGTRSRISPTAKLIAPCWVGDQVFVEPKAVVGPGAIIEDRSVIEREAQVVRSWVGPDTFVGPLTSVLSSIAWGSTLINWKSDSMLQVPDPFLMCSLARTQSAALIDRFGRALAKPGYNRGSHLNWVAAWRARSSVEPGFEFPGPGSIADTK